MSGVFPAFCPVHSGIPSSLLFRICRTESNCIWIQHTSRLILFMGLILAYTAHLFDSIHSKNIIYVSEFLCIHWTSVCSFWQRGHVKGHAWKPCRTNFTLLKSESYFLYIFHGRKFMRRATREQKNKTATRLSVKYRKVLVFIPS